MRRDMDQAEIDHPELKNDDMFASAVVGAYQASRGRKTLSEIATALKQRSADAGERKALTDTAEKIAGQTSKARQAQKGSPGWTRDSIKAMSPEEYDKHAGEIFDANARGEIE